MIYMGWWAVLAIADLVVGFVYRVRKRKYGPPK